MEKPPMNEAKRLVEQTPCIVQQKQPERCALRLKAVGGNLTIGQLRTIAQVADEYGAGGVHLSTRQGVEIHHIRDEAITQKDDTYLCDMQRCILCSVCVVRCPEGAWKPDARGVTVLIGGTMGKLPRLAVPLKRFVADEQELFQLIECLVEYYRAHGRAKERLGHMMERMGEERVIAEVLALAGS